MADSVSPPIQVEIRVNGKTVSTILAASFAGTEDRHGVTFSAERWLPTIPMPPNDAIPGLTGTVLPDLIEEKVFRAEASLRNVPVNLSDLVHDAIFEGN
ncbi:hypothetical protein [Mycolicibacterium komossense]|uniref:Uncharacterized protein n=1 Tax=Mycolicibacterium komossense TaxID=1779 RepID=A0ABT3CMN4_9MYCO|nr:hypothetical protein [Mycolicibacterium komossense]MCV7230689.1 hypothetical protein [Mycolicibacterium komossense]